MLYEEKLKEILKKELLDDVDLTIKPNIKPIHGNCCTCQECGYYHDECNCEVRVLNITINNTISQIKALNKEICICAAVKATDGTIVRGHRHGDCIHTIIHMGKEAKGSACQGFMTSRNRFVDREEGARLQNEAGIQSVWTKGPIKKILFSEDLY